MAGRFGALLGSYLWSSRAGAQSVHVARNDFLYVSGQHDSHLYLIESGHIKTLMHAPSGKGCLLDIYSRGDVIGESCLLGGKHAETAIAMLHTVVTKVPRARFVEVLSSAGLVEECLRYHCARLTEQQQAITLLATVDSELRLAITLQRLAGALGTRCGDRIRIEQRLTHEELSDMIGTTRSRVGHFLKKFRSAGLLADGGPFLVVVESRLARYVNASAELPAAPCAVQSQLGRQAFAT